MVDFANVSIGTPNNGGSEIKATLSGKVSVKLILDLAIDYRPPFSLKRVRFVPTVEGKLEAKLEGKVKGSLGEVKIPVSTPLLGPTLIVVVGGVPVVFTPTVQFYAVANGEIESGFELTSSVEFSTGFGAELNDGRVSPVGEASASANLVPSSTQAPVLRSVWLPAAVPIYRYESMVFLAPIWMWTRHVWKPRSRARAVHPLINSKRALYSKALSVSA